MGVMLLLDILKFAKRWNSFPVISWVRASRAYRSGNYEKASILYERGLHKNINHNAATSALLDLSFCQFKLKKTSESEKYLKILIQKYPDQQEAYGRLARLLLWSKRTDEALCVIKQALRITSHDESFKSLYLLAATNTKAIYEQERDLLYEFLHENDANNIEQIARARIFFYEENTNVAKTILTKLCTASPCPLEALHSLAEILLSEGNVRVSKYFIKRALSLSPDNPTSLFLLAKWYSESSAPHYAVEHARKACQLTGWKSSIFLRALTEAELSVGDKVSALLVASKAEDLHSGPEEKKFFTHLVEELSEASLY